MMNNEELNKLVMKLEEFWMAYDLEIDDNDIIEKAIEIVDKVYYNQSKGSDC